MNFLFVHAKEYKANGTFRVPHDARFDRLRKSVDLEKGARFRVAIERRGRGTAVLKKLTTRGLTAEVSDLKDCRARPALDLIIAVPRPKVLRRLLPRIVSMGIDSLTLVNACGVLKEYFDTHWLARDKLQELVMLGLEQGGACTRPTITVKKRLKPFVEDSLPELHSSARLVCIPHGGRRLPSLKDVEKIMVAIGPETGWTDFEEALFEGAGFKSYSMGEEHMPSDVAAIGVTAIVKSRLF